MDRRQFLVGAGLLGVGGLTGSCRRGERPRRPRAGPDRPGARSTPPRWPVVKAQGTPFEIGVALGRAAQGRIARLIARRGRWFGRLKAFALQRRSSRMDGFVAAVKQQRPQCWQELRGIAHGARRSLEDILVLNLQPELNGLRHQCGCGNCSTLHLVDGKRVYLAHNEDDHAASRDLMLVVRARPRGQPAFLSLAYPGILPGNVPAMTSAGLVQTTNYIGAAAVKPGGLPRYVVGRSLLSARTLDEAVRRARGADGAYSFHVSLGSRPEGRLVSLELGPGGVSALRETKNELYVHTNHYVLPSMRRRVKEIPVGAGGSSDSRYRVLTRALAGLPPLGQVGPDRLLRLLSSHEALRQPYAPCRHPLGAVRGQTVGTALFDVAAGTFDLYEGNPCAGRRRRLTL